MSTITAKTLSTATIPDLAVRVLHAIAGAHGHQWAKVPVEEVIRDGCPDPISDCTEDAITSLVCDRTTKGVMGWGVTAPATQYDSLRGEFFWAHSTGTGSEWWKVWVAPSAGVVTFATGVSRPGGDVLSVARSVRVEGGKVVVGEPPLQYSEFPGVCSDGTPFLERHARKFAENVRVLTAAAIEAVQLDYEHRFDVVPEITSVPSDLYGEVMDLPNRVDQVAVLQEKADELRLKLGEIEESIWDWTDWAEKTAPTE